ncbi:transposon Tf2-6 polyprotein [Trichonephila clavipes]|nr:transposon Tf2-6 polyprotein [Trichonephila clavipes]
MVESFFKNDEGHNVTVNGDRYRAMITNFFIPELNNNNVKELCFQQDGATCHTDRATIDLLKDTFGDRLISRFGPVNWPPRSCDLTPLDYFLWGYVKSFVYADKPQTLDHLEDNIRRVIADIRLQMLKKVIENWTSRLDYIRASRGSPMPEIIFEINAKIRKNKVVDAFTKFTSLYPVKTVSAESALEKLKQQQKTFGNPIRIISDRGSAFTSKLFNDYCDEENIQHLQIATGVPRGNGQVERIHRTLIPVLTKLSLDDSTKWYKYVDRLQRILNRTISRSTKWTPFELLVGIKMRNKEDILIKDLLLEEMAKELLEQREFLRNDAKKNIESLQSENRKTYNRRRKKASLYKEGDLVAIQRTQFGAGLKLRPKFLGPYKVTKVNSKDRYEVEKVGQHDGPNSTTTSADLMKHFYAFN